MKENLLNVIYGKLSDGFQTSFLRPDDFEKLYTENYSFLLEKLTSLIKSYYKQRDSESKDDSIELIKIHKEEFLIRLFNKNRPRYLLQTKYTIENLDELKDAEIELYNQYEEEYDLQFSERKIDYGFEVPLMKFVVRKVREHVISSNDGASPSLVRLFWNFCLGSFTTSDSDKRIWEDQLVDSPEGILGKFRIDYLSTDLPRLFSIADKQLSGINFSGFESCIINVGEREFEIERSGWLTNRFKVINKGNYYTFSNSVKDEARIQGKFVHIFILQLNKRHLLKISITIDETEQTPYIIYKDFEKVSLKNECEIFIAKHHGNETIIFDSKKEAFEFQTTVLEIKEGRGRSFDRN